VRHPPFKLCDFTVLRKSAAERPHLSGARGVGQVLQDGFELDISVNSSEKAENFF
jgi:hypothetical protein